MRILATIWLCLISQLVFGSADYAREKKWADEITPGIVVGDPVYLELKPGPELKQGHKFLSLLTTVPDAKTALVVVHGLGIHPDWGMVGTLRTQLADLGYTTLSIQMPVLANEAEGDQYVTTFPEAAARIAAAVDFLKAKGYRWNGDKKCWHNTLTDDDAIKEEVVWLKENVYGGKSAKVEVEVLNCFTRFSNRSGNRGIREI